MEPSFPDYVERLFGLDIRNVTSRDPEMYISGSLPLCYLTHGDWAAGDMDIYVHAKDAEYAKVLITSQWRDAKFDEAKEYYYEIEGMTRKRVIRRRRRVHIRENRDYYYELKLGFHSRFPRIEPMLTDYNAEKLVKNGKFIDKVVNISHGKKKVQIVVIKDYVPLKTVIASFDISVCSCAWSLNNGKFYYFGDGVKEDIERKQFHIRPQYMKYIQSAEQTSTRQKLMKRLEKYISRGFRWIDHTENSMIMDELTGGKKRSPKRKSPKGKKSSKRKSPKGKSPKRKSPAKSPKRRNAKSPKKQVSSMSVDQVFAKADKLEKEGKMKERSEFLQKEIQLAEPKRKNAKSPKKQVSSMTTDQVIAKAEKLEKESKLLKKEVQLAEPKRRRNRSKTRKDTK